jgi:hypothetical protein
MAGTLLFRPTMKFALAFVLFGLAACTSTDDTLYLTGTEEHAVRLENGQYVCEAPKKVLICHIPPGNPDNRHTICVGAAAVDAHQSHHGDLIGACDDGGEDPPDEPPPPPPPEDDPPPPPEDDPPPPDEPPPPID